MALHQCDLFRDRHPADYLARSAALNRCSVGPLSCTRRLRVDREYRVPPTASGLSFVCKDVGSPRLRLRLPQTPDADGRSHRHDDEPCAVRHPTARLPAGSHAPGAPEDDVSRGGGHHPQSRRLGVELRSVRRRSVSGRLPRAKRGRHHEDRHGCPPARRGNTPGGSQQDHADHNTCVLTTRTLQGLGPCRGPQRQHTPCCRVRSGGRDAPRRVGVHWAAVNNGSPALHAALSWSFPSLRGVALDTCHLPMKYEAVSSHRGSADPRMLRRLVSKYNVPFPSEVCPDVDGLETFQGERNQQFTATRCSSATTCVARHCPWSTQMPQSPA